MPKKLGLQKGGNQARLGGCVPKILLLLICNHIWLFSKIGVLPPNHPILIGFGTIINHPFWGTRWYQYFWKHPHIYIYHIDVIYALTFKWQQGEIQLGVHRNIQI